MTYKEEKIGCGCGLLKTLNRLTMCSDPLHIVCYGKSCAAVCTHRFGIRKVGAAVEYY